MYIVFPHCFFIFLMWPAATLFAEPMYEYALYYLIACDISWIKGGRVTRSTASLNREWPNTRQNERLEVI